MSDALRLLATALSQLGISEAGDNRILYNRWYYGKDVADRTGSGAYAWCAVFLSWCAHEAGVDHLFPKTNQVKKLEEYFGQIGRWSSRTCTPDPGDVICFRTAGGTGRHVGLVIGADGGYIYTIEGNSANAVRLRRYSATDQTIAGYGRLSAHASNESTKNEKGWLSVTLKTGDRGEAVRALQIRLIYEGYDLGRAGQRKDGADGIYGSKTRAAVCDYQQNNGLSADGIAGIATLSKLYGIT